MADNPVGLPVHRSPSPVFIEPGTFARAFGRAPFLFEHDLVAHPLLALEGLASLAAALPHPSVEYNSGALDVDHHGRPVPGTDRGVEETLATLETENSWIALHNVEEIELYRELMDDCLKEIERHSTASRTRMCQREAYIFISSPGAVTPYHMDPEHGFLLQIHGSKTVTVYDGSEPAVVAPQALEHFYSGLTQRSMELPATAQPFKRQFTLIPGAGLHIPVTHPHYVEVDTNDYSISLSVTFRTPDLRDRADVHYWNGFLRRRGLTPLPWGRSLTRDRAKKHAGRFLRRAAHFRRRARSSRDET